MRLVSWNTQWCRGLDGRVSPQRIVDVARALADFDVLCLQEIAQGFEGMPGAPGDQPAQIAQALPGWQLFFGAAVDEFDRDGRRRRFGNLIATRLPVLQVQHHPLPWPADAGVVSMPRMCSVITLKHPTLGALRVMTTHLEYYSARQRMAQAAALGALHAQACMQAEAPPAGDTTCSPFQDKSHTVKAILCGDFNLPPGSEEYALLGRAGLHDAWPLLRAQEPHAPTFKVFDRRYGPVPMACDFFFVSASLVPHLEHIQVDGATQASDHQPVALHITG
jgi:endonuclease/exonuclease/phosphatase family metal-dependent hydrolase